MPGQGAQSQTLHTYWPAWWMIVLGVLVLALFFAWYFLKVRKLGRKRYNKLS